MRIGFLTYGLNRTPTGIGRYAVELARGLQRVAEGLEVVLLTTEINDTQNLWSSFEHHPLRGCDRLPALMTLGNIEVSILAKRYHLDLIHDPNGIAPFLSPKMGTRFITTIHDTFAYIYPQGHNRLDNWRYRWMLPTALKQADRVITVSQHSRRDIIRHLHVPPEKIVSVSSAADKRFAPIHDDSLRKTVLERYGITTPYILYVGGINARKNIMRLFEAFARIRATFPHISLVIGGKRQWATREIDAMFERLGLESSILYTGYVADEDLPALYSAAEIFVFPSLYEGFGLPPLEAMACGTPVITSNTSSLPEVVGDAALMVDPYDVAGLAQAMESLLVDEDLRNRLRVCGQARAATYSWDKTATLTYEVYQEVMREKDARY